MSLEGAGTLAAIKYFGMSVIAGAAAALLGFMFMWPRTLREAFVRFTCAISCSLVFGPMLAMAAHSWWPGLFTSAREFGTLYGGDPLRPSALARATPRKRFWRNHA
jgi:CHASE2 domain-containing sensor protein